MFDESEYSARCAALRERLIDRDLDLAPISTPENICYRTMTPTAIAFAVTDRRANSAF